MGSSGSSRHAKSAMPVEPVHYTDKEAEQVREQARLDASRRFGTLATDVTRGRATEQVLGGGNEGRKRKTMGGE